MKPGILWMLAIYRSKPFLSISGITKGAKASPRHKKTVTDVETLGVVLRGTAGGYLPLTRT